jgi:Tol biopolymer transport system component
VNRTVLLLSLMAVFVAVMASRGAPEPIRLQYLTTAHQAGPVGFRDPFGAISPDGQWLVYVSNRHLYLHRVAGASTTELPPANDTKTAVRWFADSRAVAVQEQPFARAAHWFRYDISTGEREPIAGPPAAAGDTVKPPAVSEKIWGASVFSPDRRKFYYSIVNTKGTLDLWSRDLQTGDATQLTTFDRDTYDPSITSAGDVVFKSQVFTAFLGAAPAEGGSTRVLTTFQSETPTWSPDGKEIAFTFGPWRRVVDDARYPDIAQDLGIIPFDNSKPAQQLSRVFQASTSEDQGMVWSPNRKWVVFHSHRNRTDDLFLQIADGSQPPRQITTGGIETGWPRWSPDGKWIAFSGYPGPYDATFGKLYVLGIDQNTGKLTQEAAAINIEGQTETASDPNWLPDSDRLVFDSSGSVPGRKSISVVARQGGKAQKIVDYDSDQDASGIGASPDGKWVAYVALAPDGTYQIFRASLTGGAPQQVTRDPNHKTQPSFSPDGSRIAFTIWRYDVQFWMLHPQN